MNTSNKTLLQILVEELPKMGGWPERAGYASQDFDAQLGFTDDKAPTFDDDVWRNDGDWVSCPFIDVLASDYATAIITREQYEAALEEKEHPLPWDEKKTDADGWIDWAGGRIPVDVRAVVDVKFNNGNTHINQLAGSYSWTHEWEDSNIIAYRLHQPQDVTKIEINAPDCAINGTGELPKKAEQVRDDAWNAYAGITEVDDEADLNDCIGQTPEDLDALRTKMVGDIYLATGSITLNDAFNIAHVLIDEGYRKQ